MSECMRFEIQSVPSPVSSSIANDPIYLITPTVPLGLVALTALGPATPASRLQQTMLLSILLLFHRSTLNLQIPRCYSVSMKLALLATLLTLTLPTSALPASKQFNLSTQTQASSCFIKCHQMFCDFHDLPGTNTNFPAAITLNCEYDVSRLFLVCLRGSPGGHECAATLLCSRLAAAEDDALCPLLANCTALPCVLEPTPSFAQFDDDHHSCHPVAITPRSIENTRPSLNLHLSQGISKTPSKIARV